MTVRFARGIDRGRFGGPKIIIEKNRYARRSGKRRRRRRRDRLTSFRARNRIGYDQRGRRKSTKVIYRGGTPSRSTLGTNISSTRRANNVGAYSSRRINRIINIDTCALYRHCRRRLTRECRPFLFIATARVITLNNPLRRRHDFTFIYIIPELNETRLRRRPLISFDFSRNHERSDFRLTALPGNGLRSAVPNPKCFPAAVFCKTKNRRKPPEYCPLRFFRSSTAHTCYNGFV